MLTAVLLGFAMGFAGSIPLAGPVTMIVLGFGLQGRIREAYLVAIGSALPEALYGALALWGFGALLEEFSWAGPAARGITTLILLGVGCILMFRPPGSDEEKADTSKTVAARKRHLILGFSITALNPALIINWGAAVTTVYSIGLLDPSASLAIPFGLGVAAGILGWFSLALTWLRRHHQRISPQMRITLMRSMGGILFLLGLVSASRLIWGPT
jgi:threonine/homoserine/homoserine lactone efflux protein